MKPLSWTSCRKVSRLTEASCAFHGRETSKVSPVHIINTHTQAARARLGRSGPVGGSRGASCSTCCTWQEASINNFCSFFLLYLRLPRHKLPVSQEVNTFVFVTNAWGENVAHQLVLTDNSHHCRHFVLLLPGLLRLLLWWLQGFVQYSLAIKTIVWRCVSDWHPDT